MVAAIDVFSNLSIEFGWLLITYGPLRQSISGHLPEKEKKKMDERKKCPNNPNPHLLQAQ